MTRLLRTLLRRLATLAAVLIVAVAVMTLTLRLALPHAHQLRGIVAAALGDYLGADLRVGALGLHLRGLQPELTLDDAVLRDRLSGEPLLALQSLRVDLDLRETLLARAPRIDGVTLVGARLEVRRGVDGRIRVRGLDRMSGGSDTAAAAFFLREGHFSLARGEVYWTDAYAGVPPLEFRVKRLDLINAGSDHRLRLDAAPPGDAAGELTLLAELTGPARAPETWSGRIYADWRGSNLARLLRGRLPARYRLATEALHITTWNHVTDGRLMRSVTRCWLDDLVVRQTAHAAPSAVPAAGRIAAQAPRQLNLGDVGALVRWERVDGGKDDAWRLDVPELKLFGDLRNAVTTALSLRGGPVVGDGDAHASAADGPLQGRYVEAWMRGLPLAKLADVARFLAPADLPQALRTLLGERIAGRLANLRLHLNLPAKMPDGAANGVGPTWLVQGRLRDLGIGPVPTAGDTPAPVGPIPSLDGLDIAFSAAPDRGTLDVSGADVYLDLRPQTIEPFRLPRVVGRLNWHIEPDHGVTLWTRALAADTADLTTLSRLWLRTAPGESPYIDLHSHITGGDADAMPRYLPASLMDQQLQDWLDQAVVAGRLTSADLLLRGPLADFPFDNGNGWFRLELRIRDGVLDYQPQPARSPPDAPGLASAETAHEALDYWPPLEDMDVTLRFDRRSLDIDVAAARILDTAVTAGLAQIPDLWQAEAIAIQAEGEGPLADGLSFLSDTPLAAAVGGIPKALATTGTGRLHLTLNVPLVKDRSFDYAGALGFGDDAVVRLREVDLGLTDIAGTLSFDNHGLTADGIRARLGEQPITVDIATRREAADDAGRTDITASGTTAIGTLTAALPSSWWALAGGRAAWQLRASLDNDDVTAANPPLELALESDLEGVAIDLPAPFGKAAGDRRPLRVETRLLPGRPLDVAATLGDIGARLELTPQDAALAPDRVALDLNGQPKALPDNRGIAVSGRFAALDLGTWLDWGRAHAALLAAATGTGDRGKAMADRLPVLSIRLGADLLKVGALRFEDLDAALAPTPGGGWRIGIEAADNSGSVTLPSPAEARGGTPIAVRLDNLDIGPLLEGTGSATADTPRSDPRDLPALSLQVESLRRGADALGRLRLDLARADDGLRVDEFSLIGPMVSASGTGSWTGDRTDYARTAIDLRLHSDDLGRLLQTAGLYSDLAGAPAKAELALTWPGGPGAFSLARARGSMFLDIGAGRMLAVEPGVGRMLGVLNLAALERRLTLDFSDLVEPGFAFDSMRGRIGIGSGQARIEELDILAPTADIRIRGVTDLVDETFDQRARVTPKIATGVAIAGAVAGGPLVGAAVYLADKVSGDKVSELASYEYSITGSWSNPLVRRVAGNGSVPSLPDLLLPQQATGRGSHGPPGGRAGVKGNSDSRKARPASPFLDAD